MQTQSDITQVAYEKLSNIRRIVCATARDMLDGKVTAAELAAVLKAEEIARAEWESLLRF